MNACDNYYETLCLIIKLHKLMNSYLWEFMVCLFSFFSMNICGFLINVSRVCYGLFVACEI